MKFLYRETKNTNNRLRLRYYLTDDPILIGDWYFEDEHQRVLKCESEVQSNAVTSWNDCSKIFATNDSIILQDWMSNKKK